MLLLCNTRTGLRAIVLAVRRSVNRYETKFRTIILYQMWGSCNHVGGQTIWIPLSFEDHVYAVLRNLLVFDIVTALFSCGWLFIGISCVLLEEVLVSSDICASLCYISRVISVQVCATCLEWYLCKSVLHVKQKQYNQSAFILLLAYISLEPGGFIPNIMIVWGLGSSETCTGKLCAACFCVARHSDG